VIGGKDFGEANRHLLIFTEEFGLVRAAAQSIRKLESKLRYSLQDFSRAQVDLVRGREIWRVTNAKIISGKRSDLFEFLRSDLGNLKIKLLGNIFTLIKRLCRGEEKNPELFENLNQIYAFLEAENISATDLRNFECVAVLRILHSLGYIGGENFSVFVSSPIEGPMLKIAGQERAKIVSTINESLRESHL
jgi:DNA repair protein RecO